ncbi:hypothetical protein SAMN05421759_1306 [Roseivivax lentus]|uniref:Uncharacterized protein n=1 Tax=Roseivivax lentus TaxID=633194 RepID=A0A1N7Q6F1_9RHOB|nr:hypothetical protein [Roseivivax lentus]SIT18424.1 hypothetical protein SAMN05421759_1306 [Roseivivax lentus]
MPLMWTPPGADPIVQSVLMDKAVPLTAREYLDKLEQKLNRMAREADDLATEALADYLAERGAEPAETASAMMEQARETSNLPGALLPQGVFPVTAAQVKPERMPMPGMLEFLGGLRGMGH